MSQQRWARNSFWNELGRERDFDIGRVEAIEGSTLAGAFRLSPPTTSA